MDGEYRKGLWEIFPNYSRANLKLVLEAYSPFMTSPKVIEKYLDMSVTLPYLKRITVHTILLGLTS